LLKGVRKVERRYLFGVLKLQKLIAAMPGHIDQDVRAVIRHKPLRARIVCRPAVRQQPDEVLDRNLVSSVVHLDTANAFISFIVVEVELS